MLTRLKVDGFKNLVNLDVSFGPFTCIAGLNGVGKSNLFDAIRFLSMLANGHTLLDAVLSVRDEKGKTNEVTSVFTRIGGRAAPKMAFEAYMIVPKEAKDPHEQIAIARTTFLRYKLELRLRSENLATLHDNPLEIIEESLEYVKRTDILKGKGIKDHLHFLQLPRDRSWLDSVIPKGVSPTTHFITTQQALDSNKETTIVLHGTKRGRPREYPARNMPKTMLGTATAAESPTAVCAMREMQSWSLLQFEPSALRKPDPLTAKPNLDPDGSHSGLPHCITWRIMFGLKKCIWMLLRLIKRLLTN